MSDFIQKILFEANLENDYAAYQKAGKFIQRIKELVSEFPNKYVSYNPKQDFSQVKVGAMTFQIFGKNSPVSQENVGVMNAQYAPRANMFNLFHADINYNQDTKKLNIQFNEKEAIHELIHFLDFNRGSEKQTKDYLEKLAPEYTKEYLAYCEKAGIEPESKNAQILWQNHTGQKPTLDRDRGEYSNDPYELNAHFMEHIMPEINDYITKTMEVPKTFDEFKDKIFNNVLNNREFQDFYHHLNKQNKQKLLKRIGVYYQSLKTFVAKDQHVDFNHSNTSLPIHKPVLQKFFQQIKSVMGRQNKAA